MTYLPPLRARATAQSPSVWQPRPPPGTCLAFKGGKSEEAFGASGLEFGEAAAVCTFAHQRLHVGTVEGWEIKRICGSRQQGGAQNGHSETGSRREW